MSLLDLSKMESGTMRMTMRNVRIDSVMKEVVSTLLPTARKRGVHLEMSGDASALGEVRGDPERLRQVFINLAENAIKFTPSEGSVVLRAQMVEGEGDGDEDAGLSLLAPTRSLVEVRVVDTGIGIPRREWTRIFDPFYQVDSSSTREYGGTGLGLSIVKRLVESHGGAIRIEDNPPRGTAFVVTLPQASATEDVPRTAPAPVESRADG
jgi:signal transduction histidine kinase